MARNTKEKIIYSALELFSKKVYAGTNIKEIADSVEIVKSALYRHFKSKEEIWNSLIDSMEAYCNERFGSVVKPLASVNSADEFFELTMRMVDFTIHDEKVIMVSYLALCE